MITLLLLVFIVIALAALVLMFAGVFAVSFWWAIVIIADIAIAVFILRAIFKKKTK